MKKVYFIPSKLRFLIVSEKQTLMNRLRRWHSCYHTGSSMSKAHRYANNVPQTQQVLKKQKNASRGQKEKEVRTWEEH